MPSRHIHFSPLLISFTWFLPFSNGQNLHRCVQITTSFRYGKPRHLCSCISPLLVYTFSTPLHPAWAGMENPTSVYTEAHSSSAFEIGQRATILTEESLTSCPPSFSPSALPLSSKCQPGVYTWTGVCWGTLTCLASVINKPEGAGRITVTNSGL